MHHFGPLTHPTPEHGTRVATIACMILSFSAYLFFMGFMQNEGSRAVRMQTELAIAQGIQQTLVPIVDWRYVPHRDLRRFAAQRRSRRRPGRRRASPTDPCSPTSPTSPATGSPPEF